MIVGSETQDADVRKETASKDETGINITFTEINCTLRRIDDHQ